MGEFVTVNVPRLIYRPDIEDIIALYEHYKFFTEYDDLECDINPRGNQVDIDLCSVDIYVSETLKTFDLPEEAGVATLTYRIMWKSFAEQAPPESLDRDRGAKYGMWLINRIIAETGE